MVKLSVAQARALMDARSNGVLRITDNVRVVEGFAQKHVAHRLFWLGLLTASDYHGQFAITAAGRSRLESFQETSDARARSRGNATVSEDTQGDHVAQKKAASRKKPRAKARHTVEHTETTNPA